MSKIIVKSEECSNDGFTVIDVKGPGAEEIVRQIKAMLEHYEIERKRKSDYHIKEV